MDDPEDPGWLVARRGITLLLNDKNQEAEELFNRDPNNIHMAAGICYVTFLNALMCFDEARVSEAIIKIKKIEEKCVSDIGWMSSIKNKLFYLQSQSDKSLEQELEEKIVLADSLVCQSFLTFLRNDFTSYMKGGWTLRKAWKIYQHTYEQLSSLHKKIFGYSASGLSQCDEQIASERPSSPLTTKSNSSWSISENEETDCGKPEKCSNNMNTCRNKKSFGTRDFYSCSSKTISDFSGFKKSFKRNKKHPVVDENDGEKFYDAEDDSGSAQVFRPKSLNGHYSSDGSLNSDQNSSMRKSVSLFSSINSFGSALYESASHLIGLNRSHVEDWEGIDPEAVLRLMSAVCFGYGVFRLCVSLAPPYILKWMNMLGFEGDQSVAIESLVYSRKGTDMRAPLASLVLLWYNTIVRPFFTVDSKIIDSSIKEATRILREEKEFKNSALFLFFQGRVERIKPNIPGAIKAYEQSVNNASITDVKLLGLHEVGWCHLIELDYKQAHHCFLQLRHQSKWSKSFYSYMATINAGADSNIKYVLCGKEEITKLLQNSHNKAAQIDKYIRRRVESLPGSIQGNEEWVNDKVYWQLYCFEMLYLWNTFPSCSSCGLLNIMEACTPLNGAENLKYEPMLGIGWLMKGAVSVVLANQIRSNKDSDEACNGFEKFNIKTTDQLLDEAVGAFRKCLSIRSNCANNAHISAFAQYELALLLLRNVDTRPEGKALLMKSQTQYKDFDFEQRLNVRISSTLKSLHKYEAERRNSKV